MYAPPAVTVPRPGRIMWSTTTGLEGVALDLACMAGGSVPVVNNYPVANLALYVPFGVADPVTVVKLWVRTGNAVSTGNIDMGIYNPDGTKVVSMGSTGSTGIDVLQELNITDTLLIPGNYYLAINSDSSVATQKFMNHVIVAGGLAAAGVYQQAVGAVTLPSPATFAACTQTQLPWMGWSARTLVQ
jgi:hypothetical protein